MSTPKQFFPHTVLDVWLIVANPFLQKKIKIMGCSSKINSKDKAYRLKSRNHLSNNPLKWKWENIRIWVVPWSENTENSSIFRIFKIKGCKWMVRWNTQVGSKTRTAFHVQIFCSKPHSTSHPGPINLSPKRGSMHTEETKYLIQKSRLKLLQKTSIYTTFLISMWQFNNYTWK